MAFSRDCWWPRCQNGKGSWEFFIHSSLFVSTSILFHLTLTLAFLIPPLLFQCSIESVPNHSLLVLLPVLTPTPWLSYSLLPDSLAPFLTFLFSLHSFSPLSEISAAQQPARIAWVRDHPPCSLRESVLHPFLCFEVNVFFRSRKFKEHKSMVRLVKCPELRE